MNKYTILKIILFVLLFSVFIFLVFLFYKNISYNNKDGKDNLDLNDLDFMLSDKDDGIKNDENNNVGTGRQSRPVLTKKWSFLTVGDIMLSRMVDYKMKENSDLLYDYPYSDIKDLIDADINFANLETPLIDGDPVPSGTMTFRADLENASSLKKAGFNLLSLANNHTGNKGETGFLKTFETLENENINFIGAGINIEESYAGKIIDVSGLKIGFLAYVDDMFTHISQKPGIDSPGSSSMQDSDLEKDIENIKNKGAEYVIISMHSGHEYHATPNWYQEAFTKEAIDFGADLIIGHHPHVIQTVEKYNDKYIFYSLGNFIFDQMWSEETKQGLIVKFYFNEFDIEKIRLIPVMIENYAKPRVADYEESKIILDRLQYDYYEINENYYLDIS
ncbi:CapA family protein [Patescibacteria group bacterium]|nr:CapA family protein [Patescibacteria group bacterium]